MSHAESGRACKSNMTAVMLNLNSSPYRIATVDALALFSQDIVMSRLTRSNLKPASLSFSNDFGA